MWMISLHIIAGSLEVKFPTIWTDEKQRWEESEKRREEERERVRRKKIQVREKGSKVAKHCVFPMVWGSGGSKSSLAKAAGVEPAGQMRDEKLHAVVARSTFRSQNAQSRPGSDQFWKVEMSKKCTLLWREASTFRSQNAQSTPGSDHLWKLRCLKSARRCGAKMREAHFEVKNVQNTTGSDMFGPLLEAEMSTKRTPLWREAHFEVKMHKAGQVRTNFGKLRCRKSARCCGAKQAHFEVTMLKTQLFQRSDLVLRGRRKGLCTLAKVGKTWGFCSISKNDGRRGTFEEDLQRCIFRGSRVTRDMFIRAVRRSGRWFPERGCILEHQIFRFAEMIVRDRCSTSYDLASLFRGRRSTLDRWSGKIAKCIGTRPSALHSTFHFWIESRRIASFLMLSTSKNEEVSQNWIASFLTLSSSKIEGASLNCCVFDVVNFKNWKSRRIASFSCLQIDR